MAATTFKEAVLEVYPRAEVCGPTNLYWPGQGTREKVYLIVPNPVSSRSIGVGDTPDEAWKNASARLGEKEQR